MFCMNCGSKLSDDAKFCTVCGTPVKTAAPVINEEKPVQIEEAAKAQPAVIPEVETVEEVVTAPVEAVEAVVEPAIEEVVETEKPVVEDSQVNLELDTSVLEALETPEIPESEVVFDDDKSDVTVEQEPVVIPEPVIPEPTPVVPEPVVVPEPAPVVPEPVVVPEPAPVVPEPVVAPQPAPVVVAPVAHMAQSEQTQPVMPASAPAQPEPAKKVKKEKEAFKLFAFLGTIVTLVGCFLEMHSFNNWDGSAYVLRTDKFWEFTEGKIVIVGMALALIFVIFRLSSFALSGVVASWVSYGLFAMRFYYNQWDIIKASETGFSLGIGTFIIWAGLVISLIGIFIKFGKKKMFKI